ncbi:tetratricopeptide repeat protein [Oscillatoria sp. FACHB-1406]|uniref:tetratricopeptide repeat protein n=1 Tax=Oscillatoria sp. FACHB-1406 TaxID=2692846 RepID=UPI001685AA90|nr:tetratricopeptide repeat protein [Oscillatoria sp. FACHB-1406]MBD2580544.1 tetratricopeptide repeat protein [Oscillatoria sp. FACHB-1406]
MNNTISENTTDWIEQGKAMLDLGDYEAARARFEQVLQVETDNHNLWVLHAAPLTHLNNYTEALKSLDKALKCCPPNVSQESEYDRQTITLFRAVVLRELGQHQEANASFSRTFELESAEKISRLQKLSQELAKSFKHMKLKSSQSKHRAIPGLIGERLQAAGLMTAERVESILTYQRKHPDLRFGDIAVMWGWLKPETFDFLVKNLPQSAKTKRSQRLGYYLKSAALLNDFQIGTILEYQQEKRGLRFGEVAVRQGWLNSETIDFFVKHFCY